MAAKPAHYEPPGITLPLGLVYPSGEIAPRHPGRAYLGRVPVRILLIIDYRILLGKEERTK